MKNNLSSIVTIVAAVFVFAGSVSAQSVRQERKLITEGNRLYKERKFKDAASKYEEAVIVNSETVVGRYNLGLAQIKQVVNPQDTTPKNQALLNNARQNLGAVAQMASTKPGLASKANYNLGNLEFNTKEYQKAIDYYKMALRIDPQDEAARKNLRIAQKQLQNQNQDKQNQNQNQNQDKQDQNQDQNKDQNKDQNQDNKDNKEQNKINQQAADQILQANQNKENQTRARVNRATKGDKTTNGGYNRRRW